MKGRQKFFLCNLCKNMIGLIEYNGGPMTCCNEKMDELVPNTVDASNEKHLPEVTLLGDSVKVQVGSVLHPMALEHFVQFIYVETEQGGQRKSLRPGSEPCAEFSFVNDKPVAVYEYCNLHGLWKTEVK